jgi:hypothetical protein
MTCKILMQFFIIPDVRKRMRDFQLCTKEYAAEISVMLPMLY